MKLFFLSATAASLLASSSAFAPGVAFVRPQLSLASTAQDEAALTKEAMAISEKFGKASPEARVAWEAVEEVRSADNSEAMKGTVQDTCETEGPQADECIEYNKKMEELEVLLTKIKPVGSNDPEALVAKLGDVKLSSTKDEEKPAKSTSPELAAAIESASQITTEKGIRSPEAKLAWETVEEIASASRNDNATGGMLSDEECLVDVAMEACAALQQFNEALEE